MGCASLERVVEHAPSIIPFPERCAVGQSPDIPSICADFISALATPLKASIYTVHMYGHVRTYIHVASSCISNLRSACCRMKLCTRTYYMSYTCIHTEPTLPAVHTLPLLPAASAAAAASAAPASMRPKQGSASIRAKGPPGDHLGNFESPAASANGDGGKIGDVTRCSR